MSDFAVEPKTIQNVYEWFRDNRLIVNRAYQRKLVWTLDQKQKLIDSVINRYPIPLILLAALPSNEKGKEEFEIIDGMQRLHAIMSFIEQGFEYNGNFFDLNEFSRAREERDIGKFIGAEASAPVVPRSQASAVLNYSLSLSIVRGADGQRIREIFGRINSLGRSLSDQERRQSSAETDFARLVRLIATDIRGDVSEDRLLLEEMPAISVDKGTNDYGVKSNEIFWCRHGILNARNLRDSDDEQLVADILAGMLIGPVERSREALDEIYDGNNPKINKKLEETGQEQIRQYFKWIINLIDTEICHFNEENQPENNRTFKPISKIIHKNFNGNAFPSVFSHLFLALYQIRFPGNMDLRSPADLRQKLQNIVGDVLKSAKGGMSGEQRQTQIDGLKGRIEKAFNAPARPFAQQGLSLRIDFENALRRSKIESVLYEFKQGMLSLDTDRIFDERLVGKLIKTASAMSNSAKANQIGHIFIGICDKEQDKDRIESLDGITAELVAGKWIVGVDREAKSLTRNSC